MEHEEWEVIILKPTPMFLSFLAAQCPDLKLPFLHLLQMDTTAYAIHKQANEEAMLDEIERFFPKMFRYEITRRFGAAVCDDIEASFLDFLCCFKFELHSQIVLMEKSMTRGHQLLCIKPRSVLVKWVKSSIDEQEELTNIIERVNLAHMVENATVVVKNFSQLSEVKPFIKQYYRPLFKAEMLRMCDKADQWPTIDNAQKFSHYFAVEVHTQLIHLH